MSKKLGMAFMTLAVLVMPAVASAHVVVKPAEVGVGEFQTFTTGVPNEKDDPVVGLRLVIPAGLHYVSPNVKPGWTIDETKTGEGESANVTEINWTGGSIPAGQRDEFDFSAQAPAKSTSLNWKAYQTYSDGTVVSWDQSPTGKEDDGSTPYSITKVVNDLAATPSSTSTADKSTTSNNGLSLVLGLVAIVISVGGVLFRKKS